MVCASVIGTLHQTDQELTLAINSWSVPWSDGFWTMMSDIKFWIPAYIICAYFLFKTLGWKKALIVLASAALAFGLCDQVSNLVKHSVSRLRPCYSFPMLDGGLNVLEKRGGFFGFFSAHAANAFSFAVCMILGFANDKSRTYKAFNIGILTWATLVSISRIFVGKHYLGDVLVGALIGITIGYLMGSLSNLLIRKYIQRVPSPTTQEESSPSVSLSTP
ncbi:MAG: phosphatase PAP2 family protein [Bacteroidales bacterium]|nr:phosphatase PAP2 family protein [Bacteroidales bacterium]